MPRRASRTHTKLANLLSCPSIWRSTLTDGEAYGRTACTPESGLSTLQVHFALTALRKQPSHPSSQSFKTTLFRPLHHPLSSSSFHTVLATVRHNTEFQRNLPTLLQPVVWPYPASSRCHVLSSEASTSYPTCRQQTLRCPRSLNS
jgi:hypothetical protein